MSAELKTFREFLTPDKISRVNIPIYQRSYSWEWKHVDDFLNDLEYQLNSSSPDSYQFLGMVVYVFKEDQSKEIEVIDGQQRITTYYLICSILNDWIEYEFIRDLPVSEKMESSQLNHLNNVKRSIDDILWEEESFAEHDYTAGKWKLPRLYTDNTYKKDKEMTEYFLKDLEEIKKEIKPDTHMSCIDLTKTTNPLTIRHRLFNPKNDFKHVSGHPMFNKTAKTVIIGLASNVAKARPITKNYDSIKEWFTNTIVDLKKGEDRYNKIKKLINVLTKQLKVIPFQTKNHSEAFTLFEVLNDRGMAVSQADLLKNLCIKKGGDYAEKKQMYDEWKENVDEKLTKESQKIPFLRYSHNSRREFINKKHLYSGYKEKLKNLDFDATKDDFLNKEIKEDGDNFRLCLLEESPSSQEIQNQLILLNYTDIEQWKTLALALLRQPASYNNKVVAILKIVFEIVFTMKVNKKRFNLIETKFPDYAKRIHTGALSLVQLENEIKVFKNEEKLSYAQAIIDKTLYKDNKFCRLLTMMYKHVNDNLSEWKLTLEHVLPQKPKSADWSADFPDLFDPDPDKVQKAEEAYIYSIGNMILIKDTLNKSLGNKSWDLKKEKMIDLDVKDHFHINSDWEYSKVYNWDSNTIKEREKEMEKQIMKGFKKLKF